MPGDRARRTIKAKRRSKSKVQVPTDAVTRRIVGARSANENATVTSDAAEGQVGSNAWNPTGLKRNALSHAFGTVHLGATFYYPSGAWSLDAVATRSGYPCRISGYYPGRGCFSSPLAAANFGTATTDAAQGVRGRLSYDGGTHRVLVQVHSFNGRTAANNHPVRGGNSTIAQIEVEAAIMEGAATGTALFNDGLNATVPGVTWDDKFDAIGDALNAYTDNMLRRTMIRPWHEMTGGWYRWGCILPNNFTTSTAQTRALEARLQAAYRGMWQRFHDRVSARLGTRASMLKWVFNVAGNINLVRAQDAAVNCYPGDAYVDVITLDHYCEGANSVADVTGSVNWMDDFLADHPKPTGVDESGPHDNFTSTANNEDDYPLWGEVIRDWCESHRTNPNTGLSHFIDYEIDADGNAIRLFRDRTQPMVNRVDPNIWSSTMNGQTWQNNHPLLTTWMATAFDD